MGIEYEYDPPCDEYVPNVAEHGYCLDCGYHRDEHR